MDSGCGHNDHDGHDGHSDKAALGALLWAAWLLCASACGPSTADGLRPTTSAAAECPSERARCEDLCATAADCDNGKGGHACLTTGTQTHGVATKDVIDPAEVGRPAIVSEESDAGDDADAGPDEGRHQVASHELGHCARECSTALCVDPRAVCSSADGFCRTGCDATRPSCELGQACDFVSKRCMDLAAHCISANDCAVFDARLNDHGAVSCENQRCRYRVSPFGALKPLRSAVISESSRALNVQAPTPGMRIKPAELASQSFQFDVPAPVIVAAVLTRGIKSLEDGAAAAVWTAYLDHREALQGVTLGGGGEVRDGVWHRYASDATVTLPIDKQLYFFVLGYDEGRVVAQSELIPFTVGEPGAQPGAACSVPNAFCQSSGLLCADERCRTPCLSDDDCAAEGRSCSEPGMLGVAARLCL